MNDRWVSRTCDAIAHGTEMEMANPPCHFDGGEMSSTESIRAASTCLGGFLGMFLGAMLGFAICMKFMFEKVGRNDGTVQSNQALLPFLGVLVCACIGAMAGVLLIRLGFAVYAIVFSTRGNKG